jgi:transcriptional regulator with XRE-family HTH domain
METFAQRLRAAMLMAGITEAKELAMIAGITPQMARRWMKMPRADVAAWRLAPVAQRLRVRMVWLANGGTIPHVTGMLGREEVEALTILGALDDGARRRWIERGYRLTRH